MNTPDTVNKPDGNIHVIPVNDIKEHVESMACWCLPKTTPQDSTVIVHNAFSDSYGDEREIN